VSAAGSARAAITFALLACGITWCTTLPDVARRFHLEAFQVPQWLYAVGLFGPAIAAVITAVAFEGIAGLERLTATFRFRVPARWYAFALLLPFGTLGIATAGLAMAGWPFPPSEAWLTALVQTLWLIPLFLREELGWRGFLLPILLETQSPLRATVWTTLAWVLWHVPLYLASAQMAYALLMLAVIVPVSVLFTLLYLRTRSLLPCLLFHSAIDCGAAQLLLFNLGHDYLAGLAVWGGLLILIAWPAARGWSHRERTGFSSP
jgi:membrane protease YdiL (CAAX protease family)